MRSKHRRKNLSKTINKCFLGGNPSFYHFLLISYFTFSFISNFFGQFLFVCLVLISGSQDIEAWKEIDAKDVSAIAPKKKKKPKNKKL